MSLGSFSTRVTVLAREIEKNATRLVRQVALAADSAVVTATPVDTGRARSNWIVGINSDPNNPIDTYSPGQFGSTAGANVAAALAQAQTEVSKVNNGDTVFISNNLDYIGKLNNGSSAQAPANFVIAAVRAGVDAVRRAKLVP